VGVFLSCVSEGHVGPLGRRLYLPEEWARDTARRRKCHVPPSVRFAEKWRLGLKQLDLAKDVPHGWVVGDDEFGRVSEFRAKLRQRGERYVLDIPCDTLIRVLEPPSSPSKSRGRRTSKRKRWRLPPWVRVDVWAKQQPASAWQRIEVRPGEKGPLVVEVLHTYAELRDKSRQRITVIRTVEPDPKTHYTVSNAKPDVPVEAIVWAHDDRHRIEEMFELGNGEVGLDHYEVRSWVGWHHHMTLSLLALWFLVLERQRVGKKNTGDHRATSAPDLQRAPATARANGRQNCQENNRSPAA
jgi:SRSO17 transposase